MGKQQTSFPVEDTEIPFCLGDKVWLGDVRRPPTRPADHCLTLLPRRLHSSCLGCRYFRARLSLYVTSRLRAELSAPLFGVAVLQHGWRLIAFSDNLKATGHAFTASLGAQAATRIRWPSRTALGTADSWKRPIDWLSTSVSWARAWLAAVVCSTIAAFCWVTWSM